MLSVFDRKLKPPHTRA